MKQALITIMCSTIVLIGMGIFIELLKPQNPALMLFRDVISIVITACTLTCIVASVLYILVTYVFSQ